MVKRSMGLSALVSTALVATLSTGAIAQTRGPGGESFVLSGLIIFEAGGGIAYLQEPSLTGDRSVALRVSESIGPYRLTKILEDRIVLEGPAGTVLVPVLNSGGGGSGTAVAATSGRATRAGAADASAEAARPVATSSTQADTSGMRGLRDRLEIARRQVEMLQRSPQSADYRLGRQPAEHTSANPTPNATLSSSSQASAGSNQNGGPQNPGTQNPNAVQNGGVTQGGGNANVVYPPRRQTFQSILGLK